MTIVGIVTVFESAHADRPKKAAQQVQVNLIVRESRAGRTLRRSLL
jgi:hypothetical protein